MAPLLAAIVALLVAFWSACGGTPTGAIVGDTSVPATLHCAEDEVIAFVGIDTRVHIDDLGGKP